MMRWVLEVLRGKWYQCISVTMTNEQFTCIIALCDYMVWCVSQLPSYVRRTLKDSIFVPPQYLAQSLIPFVPALQEVNLDLFFRRHSHQDLST